MLATACRMAGYKPDFLCSLEPCLSCYSTCALPILVLPLIGLRVFDHVNMHTAVLGCRKSLQTFPVGALECYRVLSSSLGGIHLDLQFRWTMSCRGRLFHELISTRISRVHVVVWRQRKRQKKMNEKKNYRALGGSRMTFHSKQSMYHQVQCLWCTKKITP